MSLLVNWLPSQLLLIFLIMMMKYGLEVARIVENPLPDDAKFVSAHVEHGVIWIIIQSDSLPYVGPLEMIPQLPSTVFTRDTTQH